MAKIDEMCFSTAPSLTVSAVAIARWAKERLEGGWATGLEFVDPPAHLTTDIDAFIQLMNHNRTVEPESSPLGLGATIEA